MRTRLSGTNVQRAHVVQPVGELDEQHAHVVGDREQQLAEVLGLLGLLGDEIELLELGEAVDERADLLAEQLIDLGARRLGVLDRVVQERRRDGGVVELADR
jgi:chorismate mutase